MRTYLDHAATALVLAEALEAMREGLVLSANPSSPHAAGRAARRALENARERVARALGWSGEVIFTSGASEALGIALGRSHATRRMVSAVEHEAVTRQAPGARFIPVDAGGLVAADAVQDAMDTLVAVQQVNNETGVMQPLGVLYDVVRAQGGVLLADCAQGAGKVALPPCDMAAISAHKFGGPPGIGALLVRDLGLIAPSGGQERGYRGGTENVAGAMAMATALEMGHDWMDEALRLRAMLEDAVIDSGGQVIAAASPRIATIGSYRIPGFSAAAQLIRLDAAGIAVSAGSACSSGSLKASHVLTAMGIDEKAAGEVIRVSIGRDTTEEDIGRFLEAWRPLAQQAAA
ncbi:cysteine desulfurase family protein [Croceicoccus naphthovorans]|uniref:Cysteine desulfurase n=1 Tax=Croceicoccus naphthovorans TaxID=1348774 RepID=A0A0G3XHW6_9SPHN|nr:aminotransferase class V-fold PLP-dependent enzyme [Croceicoccus naphthovorans]AKM10194.1 aminotransferase [Croceicoccus naphthovorans]MBB3990560.1 cysteine desulfurase [Croceicoccus naphthovorans]